MNAGEFLIAAAYEVPAAAIFAIAAKASEEADAYALPDGPALYVGAKRVDPANGFMAGHPRPVDWKHTVHSAGIRMAHAASLDANPYLAWPRIAIWLPHELKPSRGHSLYRSIGHAFHHQFLRLIPQESRRHAHTTGRARA
jgi:hypothetical protein